MEEDETREIMRKLLLTAYTAYRTVAIYFVPYGPNYIAIIYLGYNI